MVRPSSSNYSSDFEHVAEVAISGRQFFGNAKPLSYDFRLDIATSTASQSGDNGTLFRAPPIFRVKVFFSRHGNGESFFVRVKCDCNSGNVRSRVVSVTWKEESRRISIMVTVWTGGLEEQSEGELSQNYYFAIYCPLSNSEPDALPRPLSSDVDRQQQRFLDVVMHFLEGDTSRASFASSKAGVGQNAVVFFGNAKVSTSPYRVVSVVRIPFLNMPRQLPLDERTELGLILQPNVIPPSIKQIIESEPMKRFFRQINPIRRQRLTGATEVIIDNTPMLLFRIPPDPNPDRENPMVTEVSFHPNNCQISFQYLNDGEIQPSDWMIDLATGTVNGGDDGYEAPIKPDSRLVTYRDPYVRVPHPVRWCKPYSLYFVVYFEYGANPPRIYDLLYLDLYSNYEGQAANGDVLYDLDDVAAEAERKLIEELFRDC